MLSLREIPFLTGLGWDDIHELVSESEVREYSKEDIFVGRGQWINRLYILLQG
jgi:signal-transduction protein with cAMP-binding, CBS, and nucleotidyltransferase domain